MLDIDEGSFRDAVQVVLSRKFYAEGVVHTPVKDLMNELEHECIRLAVRNGTYAAGNHSKQGTIAVDFDGVIHRYSRGWKDGSIYDPPVEESIESLIKLMDMGFSVYVHSTRSPRQIVRWFENSHRCGNVEFDESVCSMSPYWVRRVYPWEKFWNKKNVLGVTRRKLPALLYIDDRGWEFSKWTDPQLWMAIHHL